MCFTFLTGIWYGNNEVAYVTWVYSSSCNNCMMTASNTIEAFYVLDAKTLHKLIYSSHRLYEVDKETDI